MIQILKYDTELDGSGGAGMGFIGVDGWANIIKAVCMVFSKNQLNKMD